jgi:2-polyprenyl-6-hydroxyphenyl methylase/3-demethylubiquinone-9 3-methyltransferase
MTGTWLWCLPLALQGLAMGVDEFGFHRRRRVPRWEWLGHMVDTTGFLACLAIPLSLPPGASGLRWYLGCAAGSCLLITKDEFAHQRLCNGAEHWLHAALFILHPMVLATVGVLWFQAAGAASLPLPLPLPGPIPARALILAQAGLAAAFLALQAAFGAGRRAPWRVPAEVDNGVYDQLGERWYQAEDDPIALLRAENRLLGAWILEQLGPAPLDILDVGCGGGLLANPLAAAGHRVMAVDLSRPSLAVARRHDPGGTVAYLAMDARRLAFAGQRFDAVCMMDFLEHVEDREAVLAEAARVLRPGGRLFCHTFNRTPASWLLAVHGLAWVLPNVPERLHVFRLFLKPAELEALCARQGLKVEGWRGVRPRLALRPWLRLLARGRVGGDFAFAFGRSLRVGYCGVARR